MSEEKIDYNLAKTLSIEICKSFDKFKMQDSLQEVKINPLIVWVAVISWLKDLDRHISFHCSDEADEFKKAGYLMYWLVKTKPISFVSIEPSDFQINSAYLAINEEFALCHALHRLNIRASYINDSDLLDRFAYALFYRDDNAKSLVSKVELLYKTVPPYLRHKN
jgi:hypothetical protein